MFELPELLRLTGALLEGHFVLSSGLHSDCYIQCARLLQHPQLAEELCKKLAQQLQEIAPVVDSESELSRRDCEKRMREVLAEPGVPGAPGFESQRATLLARVKAEPVFFTRTPDYAEAPETLRIKGYRAMLAEGNPFGTITRIM